NIGIPVSRLTKLIDPETRQRALSFEQEEAFKWELHDKVVADTDDHHIVIEAPRYQTMSFKIVYTLLENGSRFSTNGIPTSRVMCKVEPHERQRHMIIEVDYPLLETNEAILFLKLTIGVCGSKQEKALKWEPHDKVVADTDDHHIVIEALSSILSWKMVVNSASYTLEIATNGIPTSRVMWEVELRKRQRHMIIELDYPLLETNEAILFSKLTIGVCGSKTTKRNKEEKMVEISSLTKTGRFKSLRQATNGIPTSRVMWEVEPRKRHMHMIIE
nr:hypothetical protein [Tanacetum cinerariifolium]